MSFFGLLLLAYGVIRINEGLAFPSKWALIPIVGALLVISAGSKAWFNRVFLMNPLAVWFGLISYPLYLWHWPILSFLHIVDGGTLHRDARIMAVLLSILLAWLTYRFVERKVRFVLPRKPTTIFLIIGVVIIGAVGGYISNKNGFAKEIKGYYSFTEQYKQLDSQFIRCENSNIYNTSTIWDGYVRCWQSKKGEPNVILLGDSHAEHLFYGFATELASENVAFYIENGRPYTEDNEFKVIFSELLRKSGAGKKIILATYYREDFIGGSLANELDVSIKALKEMGYEVAIVGDVPTFGMKPRQCNGLSIRKAWSRNSSECQMSVAEAQSQRNIYDAALRKLADINQIPYVIADELLCDQHSCSMFNENLDPLYLDTNHLNLEGSLLVGGSLVTKLRGLNFLGSL